jgi:Flp pilus assembly pilin Flp
MELYFRLAGQLARIADRVRGEESGQTMTEYALLVALIAIVLIAAIQVLTGGISSVFNGAGAHLSSLTT